MFNMFATPELVNTQHIKLGKAQRVSISYITERVTVHMTDGETLVLQEYLTERDPELFARITADPDGVTIRNGDRSRMFSALRGYIEVYLPR